MRITPLMPQAVAGKRQSSPYVSSTNTNSIANINRKAEAETPKSVLISFTGNTGKNVLEGLSVSVEDGYIGLGMYKSGGAGGVADQLPTALNKDGMNFKHVVPLYSFGNKDGQIRVLVLPKDFEGYSPFTQKMPENWFISVPETMTREEVAKQLRTEPDRIKFVVQDTPETPNKELKELFDLTGNKEGLKVSPFRELIPTEVSGTIQRIDENNLGQIKSVPYRVYRMIIPKGKTLDTDSVLCIHTKDMAKFMKAYTYSPELKDHPHVNLFTRDFGDAAADMLPKLNTAEFGHFNPANVIGHCRTGFPITESIINRSQNDPYYRGFKIIDIFHNPMENYQGNVGNPLDFLRYKATVDDYHKLAQMPEFGKLLEIDKHRYHLSPEEAEVVDRIIKPFLQYYIDDKGTYNHSITPLIARKVNPETVSINHVSHTFANEAIIYDDMCKGLTSHFRAAEAAGDKVPGRPNGCNIDGFKVNDPNGKMGNNNGLSKDMSWYTPYDPKTAPTETLISAKRSNTKAFLDMIGEATEQRMDKIGNFQNASTDDALNQLFYSKDLIEKQRYVLGGLSKFHDKDILLMSWGRSDAQKGFPIAAKALLKFLQREDVPAEWKKHFKLAMGSGPEPWPMDDKGVGHFHMLKDTMHKIQQLDDGAYKGNFMYGNGFFPARVVTCATYGIFTSEGEPQGLSCPECLQTGTPAASLNTGGAGEMIVTMGEDAEKVNGFKTPDAFMRNVEDLGWPEGTDLSKLTAEQIEARRIELAADQVADMYVEMARVYHEQPELYAKMATNAGRSEFDWHNNHALNNGRSSVQLYKEDAMEVQKGWEGRSKNPMRRLVGEFGGKIEELKRVAIDKAEESVKVLTNPSGSKWQKTAAYITLGIIVLAGGGAYLHNRNKKGKVSKAA